MLTIHLHAFSIGLLKNYVWNYLIFNLLILCNKYLEKRNLTTSDNIFITT